MRTDILISVAAALLAGALLLPVTLPAPASAGAAGQVDRAAPGLPGRAAATL